MMLSRTLTCVLAAFLLVCFVLLNFDTKINFQTTTIARSLRTGPQHGEYHYKMYNYSSNSTHHKKAWMVLEEVDGLKNEDVVVLITSTSVKQFAYLRERIISGSRTWMRMFANVFVIVEDTFQVRFAMRHCKRFETSRFTTFECHNEPTYIVSRVCSDEYYGGAGPCCKVDDLFTYLIWERPELFAHTKFALHADDDTYFRTDQVLRWLAVIDNSGINTFPIIANGNLDDPKENVWHIKGCKEIHTNGWYQPMMLNHAALDRLKVASAEHGLAKTCSNFAVTHDVGMGPYAWMFGFYHIHIPHITVGNSGGKNAMPTDYLMIHAIKHGAKVDNCNDAARWPDKDRYNQKMVIGCGEIDHPSPGHDPNGKDTNGNEIVADMYDTWDFQKTHGFESEVQHTHGQILWYNKNVTLYANGTVLPGITAVGMENKPQIKYILNDDDIITADGTFRGEKVYERFIPKILKLEGYNTTQHSRHHDILKKWHEFKLEDCEIKGSVGFD